MTHSRSLSPRNLHTSVCVWGGVRISRQVEIIHVQQKSERRE